MLKRGITMTGVTYVCPKCGSANIGTQATLYWSIGRQCWEDNGGPNSDSPFECGDCDETTWSIDEWERPLE